VCKCSETHKFSIDGMQQRARVAGRVVTPNLVRRCAGTPNFSVGDVQELLNLVRGVHGNLQFSVLGLQELLYFCAGTLAYSSD
jgi:ABC-type phosphonate transport system ATPase subunit